MTMKSNPVTTAWRDSPLGVRAKEREMRKYSSASHFSVETISTQRVLLTLSFFSTLAFVPTQTPVTPPKVPLLHSPSILISPKSEEEEEEEMVRKAKVEFDESPPDFDPANPYADPVAMLEYREHLVREKWIHIETAKIIRERLQWCYRIEGVNHLQKCRHLVDQYLEATRGVGWGKDHRPHEFHGPKKVSD